jgi:catechol 2,3-dioxygenase-like lactoylglutathione lyase family enzyme
MQLGPLDHVNIRTANLEDMITWYQGVLGMTLGKRPPFRFPGAWLYAGERAAVHLIGVDKPASGEDPKLEHFAFSATGLTSFVQVLEDKGVGYRLDRVPEFGVLQVNIFDPDGNHIHVDFIGPETEGQIV